MKTLTPTNLIAVEVPKEAIRIKKFDLKEHDDQETGFSLEWLIKGNSFYDAKLIPFDFEILGEVTDTEISFDLKKLDQVALTIKQAEELLNEHDKIDFRSLLQSNGLYFENNLNQEQCEWCLESHVLTCHECKEKVINFYKSKLIKGKLIILKPI